MRLLDQTFNQGLNQRVTWSWLTAPLRSRDKLVAEVCPVELIR